MGFEPTRGDPIGLAGRRLSHSAKVSTGSRSAGSSASPVACERVGGLQPRTGQSPREAHKKEVAGKAGHQRNTGSGRHLPTCLGPPWPQNALQQIGPKAAETKGKRNSKKNHGQSQSPAKSKVCPKISQLSWTPLGPQKIKKNRPKSGRSQRRNKRRTKIPAKPIACKIKGSLEISANPGDPP